jgi:hypothetical protein
MKSVGASPEGVVETALAVAATAIRDAMMNQSWS